MDNLLISSFPVILAAILSSIGSATILIFYMSKKIQKLEDHRQSDTEKIKIQFDSILNTIELKFQNILNSWDSLNVRVSKLEQFKDDYYTNKVFSNFLEHNEKNK